MINNYKKIISLNITSGTYNSFLDNIVNLAKEKKSSYVCVANVHMTIEAYDDSDFCEIVNKADIVTPDGMPLAKAFKILYGVKQDRVAGMDLLPDLLEISERIGLSVYFYGGTDLMLDKTKNFINNKYPNLKMAGLFSPPFRILNEIEKKEVSEKINSSEPNIVFVVLGCPKQERWMAENKGIINACMIGVGGALPVLIGEQKRAPKWMQSLSLEWLYRFFQEPKRLFRRYFYTNTKFLYLLFKNKFFVRNR